MDAMAALLESVTEEFMPPSHAMGRMARHDFPANWIEVDSSLHALLHN